MRNPLLKAYRLIGIPVMVLGLLYGLGPAPALFGFGHRPYTLILAGLLLLVGGALTSLPAWGALEEFSPELVESGGDEAEEG